MDDVMVDTSATGTVVRAAARDGGVAVPMADVRIEREDKTVVAVLTGEVDMSNAASVRLQIAESVTPDDDALIVDLSELSFIDSAGLHSLIELGTVLDERRQQTPAVPPARAARSGGRSRSSDCRAPSRSTPTGARRWRPSARPRWSPGRSAPPRTTDRRQSSASSA